MTIDRQLVWTGTLNEQALAGRTPPRARFYDTTLRDGEQSVGVMFGPEQKLEIARLLDGLGVGRIEAGFPRVSEDDRIAIRQIMQADLRAEIWGFARALVEDVDAVADLGMRYTVVEAPISDLKLGALGVTREQVLERIRKAVGHAAARGLRVRHARDAGDEDGAVSHAAAQSGERGGRELDARNRIPLRNSPCGHSGDRTLFRVPARVLCRFGRRFWRK